MVMLYKDPDDSDLFPVQTEPQVALKLTQDVQSDFVDIDALKHKITQLEKELMKYNVKASAFSSCSWSIVYNEVNLQKNTQNEVAAEEPL